MNTPRTDTPVAMKAGAAKPRTAPLAGSRVSPDLSVLGLSVLGLSVLGLSVLGLSVVVFVASVVFATPAAQAQGYGAQGRGGELSNLLHAYFPVARPTAGNAKVNRRQASDLVRAASGGSVDVISVRTQGNTHYVKVLTHDRPPKMRTYKVDAQTGKVWR